MLSKSQIKYIQSLGQKKQRDEDGVFIAEGPKIVEELLTAANAEVLQVYAVKDWIKGNEKRQLNTPVMEITEVELARISHLQTPNSVIAIVKQADKSFPINVGEQVSLVLDGIQDPGNMGTIIRIADWFGITQIICSTNCADRYNPKVVQSTMGSIMRVHMLYTELTYWLEQQKGVPVYAAALAGQDIHTIQKLTAGMIVIGNESKGISPAIMERVDVKLTIPRIGKAESLNAAVATGIILSHLV
jgi:RNA methyltransferase, TrmH family